MNYQVNLHDKYALITVMATKLDGVIAPDLKSELVRVNHEGKKNIIIDLSHVRYCDSSGLSAILVGNRLCKNDDGTFVLCNLQPMVEKLVSISQLNNILNITPTLDEAIDFLTMEEVERELGDE